MINIKGIIGEDITYVGFLAALEDEKKNASRLIEINIDSIGGFVDDGLAIYYVLMNLKNEGYKISTRCMNNCASIASVIFMAGDNRIASTPIMIHNPWVAGVEGDARTLSNHSKNLQSAEKELEEIYQTYCTLSPEIISDLMDSETYITPDEAVSLGFATESASLVIAKLNVLNINQKSKNMANSKTTWNALKDKMKASLNKNKMYALELETVDGTMLQVDREEGLPQVGDSASPDGVFELPEGLVVTVVDGVITEVTEIAPEEAPVPEEIVTYIEELISEIEGLKAQAKTNDEKKILNAVRLAGGMSKLLAGKTGSAYRPESRTSEPSKVQAPDMLANQLAAAKERLQNKTKK